MNSRQHLGRPARRHAISRFLCMTCHHCISVEPKKHSVTQLMQTLCFLKKWHQVRGIWLNIAKIRQTLYCNRFRNSSLVSGRHKGLFFPLICVSAPVSFFRFVLTLDQNKPYFSKLPLILRDGKYV